jgi:hypothetical protein
MPQIFANITECKSRESVYTNPDYPTGKHVGFKLCKGVGLGKDCPGGFPTLETLDFTTELKFIHVNIFGNGSR